MPTGHLLRIKQKDTLCKMYKKTNKRIVSKQDFDKRVPFSKEKKQVFDLNGCRKADWLAIRPVGRLTNEQARSFTGWRFGRLAAGCRTFIVSKIENMNENE